MGKKICSNCGGDMKTNGVLLECKICGYSIMKSDYGHEDDFDRLFGSGSKKDDIPEGCAACGGPYPSCKISCTLFDD